MKREKLKESERIVRVRKRNRRIQEDRKKSPYPSAKDTIQRRKNESLKELAPLCKYSRRGRTKQKPKQEKTDPTKSELLAFIERCDKADEEDRRREYLANERSRIKESVETVRKNLSEIETKRLKLASKNAIYSSPPKIKLPKGYIDKPLDMDISKEREKVLEKQKKYWG